MSEQLCTCGHLTSDHEVTTEWTPEQLAIHGSPCNRCNADPHKEQRKFYHLFCTGFREWPLTEMPWPGTFQARELGCTCAVGVNLKAQKEGSVPTYAAGCVVHDWVCKRGTATCVHTEDGTAWEHWHDRPHESCEHCTVPKIVCGGCGEVWGDWRVTPEKGGWKMDLMGGALVCGAGSKSRLLDSQSWKCSTCGVAGEIQW